MKILFITSSRLGDAILSTSVLHYLETQYPHLDVTVVSGALPSDLFRSIPFVSEVILLNKQSFSRHWLHLWKHVRHHTWDRVIDLRGSFIGFGLKARKRHRWQKNLLNEGHQVKRLRRLMTPQLMDGVEGSCENTVFTNFTPKLWLENAHLKNAREIIQNPTLAVAPTANWIGKQWPPEHFIEVLGRFLYENPNDHDVLLIAAPHEGQVLNLIKEKFASPRIKILLSADLGYVASCLSLCDVFLGNDSGLMHMSAALGVPTIGLFGPSDHTRYGPFGEGHQILRIPQSLKELEKSPGFSYSAPACYMTPLSTLTVWSALQRTWEAMHAKVDQLAHIPLRSKG